MTHYCSKLCEAEILNKISLIYISSPWIVLVVEMFASVDFFSFLSVFFFQFVLVLYAVQDYIYTYINVYIYTHNNMCMLGEMRCNIRLRCSTIIIYFLFNYLIIFPLLPPCIGCNEDNYYSL